MKKTFLDKTLDGMGWFVKHFQIWCGIVLLILAFMKLNDLQETGAVKDLYYCLTTLIASFVWFISAIFSQHLRIIDKLEKRVTVLEFQNRDLAVWQKAQEEINRCVILMSDIVEKGE